MPLPSEKEKKEEVAEERRNLTNYSQHSFADRLRMQRELEELDPELGHVDSWTGIDS
jgi:hypothetical protein